MMEAVCDVTQSFAHFCNKTTTVLSNVFDWSHFKLLFNPITKDDLDILFNLHLKSFQQF